LGEFHSPSAIIVTKILIGKEIQRGKKRKNGSYLLGLDDDCFSSIGHCDVFRGGGELVEFMVAVMVFG
jgi:hypothetical protein